MGEGKRGRHTVVEVPVGRIVEELLEEGIAEWQRASLGIAIGLLLQRQLDGCGDHGDCCVWGWTMTMFAMSE